MPFKIHPNTNLFTIEYEGDGFFSVADVQKLHSHILPLIYPEGFSGEIPSYKTTLKLVQELFPELKEKLQ